METEGRDNELDFEEFLGICSDSGLINEKTARKISTFAKAIGGVGALPRLKTNQPSTTDDFGASLISKYPENMTFNNYVTTEENYYATEIARTISLIPRVWQSITPVMLHAHTGQGKTHLLAAISRATPKSTLILNTVDLNIEFEHCCKAGVERELRDWITSYDLLMLDDIQFTQGDLQFQKFLISVINRMPRGKHGIITSSDVHPRELLDIDSSFYSRLTSGLVIKLEIVNLEGRKEILRNLFGLTGIIPDEEIIDYIASHVTMNVRQLKAAGRMVLAQMLGPSHEVSLSDVRDILKFMQVYDDQGGDRPRAAEMHVEHLRENQEVQASPSPFIVVDIDEEIKVNRPASEIKAEEPSADSAEEVSEDQPEQPVEPADTGSGVRMPPITAPSPEEVIEPPVEEDHIFKAETGVTHDVDHQGNTKYRSMVESASTVEHQIEALKAAVSDRIKQLEAKSADQREIDKLRFALAFLSEGKLESAMLALRPE